MASDSGTAKRLWLSILCIAGVAAVALLDYLTGSEISFALLYLVPVCACAWYLGRWPGLALSGLAAIGWLVAELAARPQPYSHATIPVWNASTRLGFFLIVAFLLDRLRTTLDHERQLARTDSLTGAANPRAFREAATLELMRARRYGRPLSLVYLDVDDFKQVNDRHGHAAGDRMLTDLVQALRDSLRRTDTIARLGGDEFAVLMPETDEDAAVRTVERLREEVVRRGAGDLPPVSMSAGLLVCREAPASVDELLERADELMYGVKGTGKGGVRLRVVEGNGDGNGSVLAGGRPA